jgi:hypothetical protein
MTDAPVDLDELEAECQRRLEHAGKFRFIPFMNIDARQLSALIAELRAARVPVEAEASWRVAWERVCPEAARSARLGWFDGKNKREGFEAGYLAAKSRAAPPADEVAGLTEAERAFIEACRAADTKACPFLETLQGHRMLSENICRAWREVKRGE